MNFIQQCLVEYREYAASVGCDLRMDHWQWHHENQTPQFESRVRVPEWGADNDYGTRFLEMHRMMLYAEEGHCGHDTGHHMPYAGMFPWFRDKGYALPPFWDGKTAPPEELAYTPPVESAPDPSGMNFPLARNPVYPPRYACKGFPLPACFTPGGASDQSEMEGCTGIMRLGDFRNVNQLGCCIGLYHDSWHAAIGGPMMSRYFSTDDPVFYFGVHYTIDNIYADYLALKKGT